MGNVLNDILIVIITIILCSEFAELLLLWIGNGKIPKSVKLTDSDFDNCKLNQNVHTIIHMENIKYQYISTSFMSLIVKYHVMTKDYTNLIPIFRFSKNSKLINNKFKELKNGR